MGDNPTAGDHYILHIPQAFEADGVTPSVLKPVAGAIAEIYVVDPEGQSVLAGSVEIPVSGTTLAYDVSLTAQDEPAGQTLNETSGTNCGAGTCGAVGVVCPLLLIVRPGAHAHPPSVVEASAHGILRNSSGGRHDMDPICMGEMCVGRCAGQRVDACG